MLLNQTEGCLWLLYGCVFAYASVCECTTVHPPDETTACRIVRDLALKAADQLNSLCKHTVDLMLGVGPKYYNRGGSLFSMCVTVYLCV